MGPSWGMSRGRKDKRLILTQVLAEAAVPVPSQWLFWGPRVPSPTSPGHSQPRLCFRPEEGGGMEGPGGLRAGDGGLGPTSVFCWLWDFGPGDPTPLLILPERAGCVSEKRLCDFLPASRSACGDWVMVTVQEGDRPSFRAAGMILPLEPVGRPSLGPCPEFHQRGKIASQFLKRERKGHREG